MALMKLFLVTIPYIVTFSEIYTIIWLSPEKKTLL
jgi:hypothetical protein